MDSHPRSGVELCCCLCAPLQGLVQRSWGFKKNTFTQLESSAQAHLEFRSFVFKQLRMMHNGSRRSKLELRGTR
eukprot:15432114-Alexandrium_andersonii.AAC.1